MGDGGVRPVCSMSVSPAWYICAGARGAGPAGVPTTERGGTQAVNRPRRHADRAVTRRLELVLGPASIRPPLVATPPSCLGTRRRGKTTCPLPTCGRGHRQCGCAGGGLAGQASPAGALSLVEFWHRGT